MNTKLMEQVEKRLRERPETYNQNTFLSLLDTEDDWTADRLMEIEHNRWECGAVACVAGHAVAMSGRAKEFTDEAGVIDFEVAGAGVLDLDTETAAWLFSAARRADLMPEILRRLREGQSVDEVDDWEYSQSYEED